MVMPSNYELQTKKNGMNNKIKYDLWTTFLEEYNEIFKTYDELFSDNLLKLKIFIKDNQQLPHRNKNKYLSQFLRHQMENYKNMKKSMLNSDNLDAWTIFIETYSDYFKDNWYTFYEELHDYIIFNHALPKWNTAIGRWTRRQNKNYTKKLESMLDNKKYELWSKFLEENKKYFICKDEKWNNNLKDIIEFIKKNKKLPSSSKTSSPADKTLSKWLTQQKCDFSNNNMYNNIDRYNKWVKFRNDYKDYQDIFSLEEHWYLKFNKLKLFINVNKTLPKYKKKCKTEENIIYNWLHHQTDNYKYKKAVMTKNPIFDLWTIFLEEYKEYFDNSETQSTEPKPKPPKKKSMKLATPSVAKTETSEQKRHRYKTEISVLHQRYKTLSSQNLRNEFNTTPELWYKYHEIAEENERSFPEDEIPRNRIIQELLKIKTKRTKQVVDLGCGKAQIAHYFKTDPRFKFINYDHISSNDTVISCDISNTPLEEDSVEICILSLAMWGSNCREYIQEAARILESNGKLYIIEPSKRWSEKDEHGNLVPEKEGLKLKSLLEENGFQVVEQSIEKFCMFVCIKV